MSMLRLLRARRGVAALEFAIVAPVLLLTMNALYDTSNAIIAWWQLSEAADAVGLIATTFAATTTNTNVLTGAQATTASTAIYAVRPSLKTASAGMFGVTLSSIVFTPTVPGCTAKCTYAANVAWSTTLQGNAPARACGVLKQAANTARPTMQTLPADTFTPAPILLVDVRYNFVAQFTTLFGSGLSMLASAYMQPRTGDNTQWVRYAGPQAAKVQCPGYAT